MSELPCAVLDILWIEGEAEHVVSIGSLTARRILPRVGVVLLAPPGCGWNEERQEFDPDAYEEELIPYYFATDRAEFRRAYRLARTAVRTLGWKHRLFADLLAEDLPMSECCGPHGRRLPA